MSVVLVFIRKIGDSVVIDGETTVTVLEVREGRVKLGFSAPERVSVHRLEVFLRIAQEGERRGRRPA